MNGIAITESVSGRPFTCWPHNIIKDWLNYCDNITPLDFGAKDKSKTKSRLKELLCYDS